MSTDASPTGMTWARAADALAARVRRRARQGTAFTRVGWALLAAAALALLWRAVAPPLPGVNSTIAVLALLGLGLGIGVLLALHARRQASGIGTGDAAWALDRLATAGGRGLAAAATSGPAASEAAFADGGVSVPPAVRLHPPRGLALVVGALSLSVLALLAPGKAAAEADEPTDVPSATGEGLLAGGGEPGGATASARRERRAADLQAQADALQSVRAALNLPPDGPLDPKEVAAALTDPAARRKAAEAAGSDAELSALLNSTETAGDAVARLIGRGEDNQAEASRARREAAGARARLGVPAVPPARRDVVRRYLSLIDRERAR